ncbi:MAG: LytTR family DNA-binding domain-containing protein [Gemmatimonadota bacterium]|nr:LytTR family DNA-binding domain-containing protein [Gemmatimonadota bacterium]
MNAPIRTLIVDDEPLARRALRALLAEEASVAIIGEARDGPEAIAALQQLRPELVLLDIRLPGASGLEVLQRANVDVRVIFSTAHDDYAVAAFELGAIDYLRKPFGRERLLRAVARARPQVLAARQARAVGASLHDQLQVAGDLAVPRTRIFVREQGSVFPLRCDDIVRGESDGDYVVLHALGRQFPVYLNLGDLAQQLNQEQFVRVHRSHLINLDHVASVVAHDPSRVAITMKDGSQVIASRAGTQLLRRRYR